MCSRCRWLLLKCSKIGIGFNERKTNCGIAHILGILLMMKSLYDLCIFRATTICCLSPLNCLRYFIPDTELVLEGKRNLVALLFILMLHHTKKNVLTLLVKFFCSGKCASQVLVCPSFHLHWVQHFFKSQVSTTDVKILRL